ncbi:sulfite exporter TauE/SafE family protein [Kocuria palustris]
MGPLGLLPELGAASWVLLGLGAAIVGVSKTALPGAATVAVGLFALVLPAKESTAALLLLLLVGDAMALWVYRRSPDVAVLLRLIPSVLLGIGLGALFFWLVDGVTVQRSIGVVLLLLAILSVLQRRTARRRSDSPEEEAPLDHAPSRLVGAGYGSLGGFTTMVANAGGPVMSLYFLSMRMPVVTFLGTAAWFFAVVNLIKLPFSLGLGLVSSATLATDLVLAPLVLIGGGFGAAIAPRIPQRVFDGIVLALTVFSALALILR